MIFLDTNIFSYFLAGDEIVQAKMQQIWDNGERIAFTQINVYELLKGFRYKISYKKEQLFYDLLKDISVIQLDDRAISIAADIYADLRKRGVTIGDADILIAAIVISNNGTLVSRNLKHYQYIKNLDLLDW
jgi:tRNA(fMet)-specific endonuclease VapC